MNSYQTVNAAFREASFEGKDGVSHGIAWFILEHYRLEALQKRQARIAAIHAENNDPIRRMAADLQLDYHETKVSNGRADAIFIEDRFDTGDVPTLHGRPKGGIAAAKAGGTSWLVPPIPVVITPRIYVRHADEGQGWEVVDSDKGRVIARFGDIKWASFTADAWNEGWTPAKYGLVKGIDTSGYTLA